MNRVPLIEAARGVRELDLLITNVNLINVFTCEIYPADIGILGNRIASVIPSNNDPLSAKKTIDGSGKWASPGFVDTHLHIESTMVTPQKFSMGVLPFGTTTVVIDPHEIGNVMGKRGVRYMIEASENLPLRIYITIPSCVPAVPGKETAGATFEADDVIDMLTWPRVIGVAEVMDYEGLVQGSLKMVGIVQAGLDAGVVIQGHAPMLTGRSLNAYLAAGIQSDHEIKGLDECHEKLRLGMLPLIKYSSFGNQVPLVAPLLKANPYMEVALCTDDIEPADLLVNGHLNRVVREMIAHGIDPARAIRFGTLNGAKHYGLRDLGAIAPGYLADIVLLDRLFDVQVSDVIVDGKIIFKDQKLVDENFKPDTNPPLENTVSLHVLTEETFHLNPPVRDGFVEARILEIEPSRLTHFDLTRLPVKDREITPESLHNDLTLVSVIPRHGQTHRPSIALVKGLDLKYGAIATTIAHDSHNLIVAGRNSKDMLFAAKTLENWGGGLIAVRDGNVLYGIPLPIAGLMATESIPELAVKIQKFNSVVREMGISGRNPALAISSLALPVVPKARLTDLGLIDVETQELLPLFV
jgi:adenine deaminase